MVRDYALAASGLLAPQIGGPSVKPYQPEGIWEAVAMLGSNTRFYKQDSGNGLYRRSLYTFWKRAAPPASHGDSERAHAGKLHRSPRTHRYAAAGAGHHERRAICRSRASAGRRGMENGLTSPRAWTIFRRAILMRPLTLDEQRIARKAYDDFARYYSAHPDDARKFLDDGERKADPGLPAAEHAALTMLANQMFNLDEVLNQ